jgi:thioredoxin reductase (NADPH)
MSNPFLVAVDDDPGVARAVERDLRARYADDYSILRAESGASALRTVQSLKQRGDSVALFLVDQRMPEMTGVEFLAQASPIFPEARKVLLTAYSDTEVAIEGINSIGLDYYLVKPWTPPERNLYPVLDDVLSDWVATASLAYTGLRVVGSLNSSDSHRVKDFLTRNLIPYTWVDVDRDPDAGSLLKTLGSNDYQLPIVFFADGAHLVNPDNVTLAEQGGLTTQPSQAVYDMIIAGAGPAGLGAAVYAASEGLRVALIESEAPGGQAGQSARIENYLGFPKGLSGADLTRRAVTQAKRFGVEILSARTVESVQTEHPYHKISISGGEQLNCQALLVATGAQTRVLDVPGAQQVTGAGLYYGTTVSEARNFTGERVFVVGAGNSAGQCVEFLSRFARRVTLLARNADLADSMSQYLVNRLGQNKTVEVVNRVEVIRIEGDGRFTAAVVQNKDSGDEQRLEGAAMFVYIGARPRTDFLEGRVKTDPGGFLLTGPSLLEGGKRPQGWWPKRDPFLHECSVPGIFAAGDVRHGSVKRVAAAIGDGGSALHSIHQYLGTV